MSNVFHAEQGNIRIINDTKYKNYMVSDYLGHAEIAMSITDDTRYEQEL